ncbi:MAG: hypothetical protein ACLSHH_08590, partial [Clostridia bacterium]
MTKTKQKYNLLIIMMTTITFLVCNLIAINFKDLNNRIVNKYVIVFIFCIGIALIKKFRKVNLESHKGLRTKIFILIWIALMSSVLISQIVNEELNIINLFILTCIIPVFFFKKESYQIDTYLKIGAILNIIPLIAVLKEINSIGILIAFIGIMSINFSIKKFVEKGKLIQYLIIVICFTFLILMTKSRTALLAFLTVGGLNYFYIVFKNKIKIKTIMI